MDELFEVLTLIQTGKLEDFPVALMGTDFFAPGIEQLKKFVEYATIDPMDLSKLTISDDPVQVVNGITETVIKRFGLSYTQRTVKKRWWLGEW